MSEPMSNIFHIYKQDLKNFHHVFKMSQVVAYVSVTDSDSGPNGVTQCSVQQEEFTLEKLDSDTYKVGLVLSCVVLFIMSLGEAVLVLSFIWLLHILDFP